MKAIKKYEVEYTFTEDETNKKTKIKEEIIELNINLASKEELDKYGDGDHLDSEGKPHNIYKNYYNSNFLTIDMGNHIETLLDTYLGEDFLEGRLTWYEVKENNE